MAKSDTTVAGVRVSADGRWWWNGREWVAALSADGVWRWDGRSWLPTTDLDQEDAARLADHLDLLAEEAFARAGRILAGHPREWSSGPEAARLVAAAHADLARLEETERRLGGAGGGGDRGLAMVLGRLSGAHDERDGLLREREAILARLSPDLSEIGRGAPEPSVKEADEILSTARLLHEKAIAISSAAAALAAARNAVRERVAAAEAHLRDEEQAREAALAQARADVEEARATHRRAAAEGRERVRRLRMPGPGERLDEFGGLALHAGVIGTESWSAPTRGATAELGAAGELAARHPDVVADLLLAEVPCAEAFVEAELAGSPEQFILLRTCLNAWLTACEPGCEDAARRFATRIAEAGAAAPPGGARAFGSALQELRQWETDHSGEEQAEERLRAVDSDPVLLDRVEQAHRRLRDIPAEGPEVDAAQADLTKLVERLLGPPPAPAPSASHPG